MAGRADLSCFSLAQLHEVIHAREGALKGIYGELLCREFGYQTLDSIPASPTPLSVHITNIGAHNLVKGNDKANRPSLAMRCDILDSGKNKITGVIEVISGSCCRHEETIFTSMTVHGENGVPYPSAFYCDGLANTALFKRVMKGEVVEHPRLTSNKHYICISNK